MAERIQQHEFRGSRIDIREFLTDDLSSGATIRIHAPDSTAYTEAVMACNDPECFNEYTFDGWTLAMSDCNRTIFLELDTGGKAKDFRESFSKVDILVKRLTELRSALLAERKLFLKRREHRDALLKAKGKK